MKGYTPSFKTLNNMLFFINKIGLWKKQGIPLDLINDFLNKYRKDGYER